MKSPIYCPYCFGILRNDFINRPNDLSKLEKICDNYVNHSFKTYQYQNSQDVYAIQIELDKINKINVLFQFVMKKIFIFRGSKFRIRGAMILPFFEPDLSNYNRLVNKLKTYILLS